MSTNHTTIVEGLTVILDELRETRIQLQATADRFVLLDIERREFPPVDPSVN